MLSLEVVATSVNGLVIFERLKLDEISWTHRHSSRVSRDQTDQTNGIGLLFEGTALQSILELLMILLLTKKDVLQKGAVQKPRV